MYAAHKPLGREFHSVKGLQSTLYWWKQVGFYQSVEMKVIYSYLRVGRYSLIEVERGRFLPIKFDHESLTGSI